jgi:hypothetical protein
MATAMFPETLEDLNSRGLFPIAGIVYVFTALCSSKPFVSKQHICELGYLLQIKAQG